MATCPPTSSPIDHTIWAASALTSAGFSGLRSCRSTWVTPWVSMVTLVRSLPPVSSDWAAPCSTPAGPRNSRLIRVVTRLSIDPPLIR